MRIAKATGKLKGYDSMRKCSNINMPVTSYSAALLNRPHPSSKSIYFIGTDEGVIHKCSYNYLNRHLDLFLAHEGPINEMKFSPFCPTFFATCGDDWHTRIWAEGKRKLTIRDSDSFKISEWIDMNVTSPLFSHQEICLRGSHTSPD